MMNLLSSKIFCFISFFLVVFQLCFAQKTLWQQCGKITLNIPFIGQTTFDDCIELIEEQTCQLTGKLSINNQQVFAKPFDLSGTPKVCGSIPGFSSCEACADIISNSTSQDCVMLDIKCSGFPIATQNLGCFQSNSIIDEITRCQYRCPNDCSSNGQCDKGICTCSTGYYGESCNISIPTYGTCVTIPLDSSNQQLCGEFLFQNCEVVFNVRISQEILYTQTFPLYKLISIFTNSSCFTAFDCSLCLEWTNLTLNYNTAGGCAAVTTTCGGSKIEYPFFCFQDSEIVSYCLGRCPSDCSFHGECNKGTCICDPKYTGNDCSILLDCGASNCGGSSHGTCNNGQCVCTPEYQGSDCSIPSSLPKPSLSNNKSSPVLGIVLGVLAFVFLVTIVGIFIYFKLRDKRDRKGFVRLELEEEEDSKDEF